MEWAKFLLPLPVFQQEKNETTIEFLRRIQYSLDKPNEMLKEDAVFWFLLGCRDDIVNKIPFNPEESMWIEPDKLEEHLVLIDKGVQLSGPFRQGRFQNTFNFFVCYRCARYGHKSAYCKYPDPEPSVGRLLKRKITELHYSDEPKPKSKSKKKSANRAASSAAGPLSNTSTITHHNDPNDNIGNIDQYKSQSQMGNSSLDFVNFEAPSVVSLASSPSSSYRETSTASQDRNPNSMYNSNTSFNSTTNTSSTSYKDYSHGNQPSSFNSSQNQQNSTFDSQNSYKSPAATAKQLPSLFDSFESPSLMTTFTSFQGDNRSTSTSNTFHSSSNNKSNNSRFNSPSMSKNSTNSNFKNHNNSNSYSYENDNDFDEPITRISRNPQSQSSRN